jgi:chemotaxis protein histidine kinase CheA
MSDAADKAAESTKKLNEETKRYADEGLKGETDYLERTQKLDIAKAKNRGATEKQVFNIEQQYKQLKINSLQRHYNEIKGVDEKAAQETLNQIKNLQNEIEVSQLNFETSQKNKKQEKVKVEKVETEQARKARESGEMLLLEQLEFYYKEQEQLRSEAFDEEFLDYADRQLMLEDNAKQEQLLAQSTFDLKSELDKQDAINKKQAASEIASTTMELAQLVGEQTAVGKTLAIAATTIQTYQAAQSAYQRGIEIPYVGMVLGPLNAAIAIGQGLKRVQAIAAVKVPGGGGGAGNLPSNTGGIGAPIGAQMGSTALQQAQINAAGSAAVQAFVLESDVSGNQERIERLNRAARIQ